MQARFSAPYASLARHELLHEHHLHDTTQPLRDHVHGTTAAYTVSHLPAGHAVFVMLLFNSSCHHVLGRVLQVACCLWQRIGTFLKPLLK
jgi:hypothetical protein